MKLTFSKLSKAIESRHIAQWVSPFSPPIIERLTVFRYGILFHINLYNTRQTQRKQTVINNIVGTFEHRYLLPAGTEKHEVLQTGSIDVAILPSCQILYNNAM